MKNGDWDLKNDFFKNNYFRKYTPKLSEVFIDYCDTNFVVGTFFKVASIKCVLHYRCVVIKSCYSSRRCILW